MPLPTIAESSRQLRQNAFMRTQLISCRLPKADSALLRPLLFHHLCRFVSFSSGGLASARESLCRGLGSRWFTERCHHCFEVALDLRRLVVDRLVEVDVVDDVLAALEVEAEADLACRGQLFRATLGNASRFTNWAERRADSTTDSEQRPVRTEVRRPRFN